ncbi:MAG: FkbM family methyltransferase [Bacillota bacterium]|uniref:FkbM family methyltransferase n=1 Tax=[Clostridium] aminophilum TaxID=1526 RepID=UPI0028A4B82E|nr:FkbM family methyltransferase [Bacillota bacterium]
MMEMDDLYKKYRAIKECLNSGIFLWGAGTNGGWCLDYCQREGFKIRGFIDSNPLRKEINGVEIVPIEKYREEWKNHPVLVTAKHSAGEILKNNKDIPLIMSFDAFFLIDHLMEYESLEFFDEESYKVLDALKEYMLTSKPDVLYKVTCHDQYFAIPSFFNTGNENFVDLGAYTGDTIEEFLFQHHGSFQHIWAFEPGEKQFRALEIRLERLVQEWALDRSKITIEKKGVGPLSKCGYMTDSDHLLGMQVSEQGDNRIEVVSLDDYFTDHDRVSFIKSDIEGLEFDMLQGAERTIRKQHPKLAISVYHKPDDLIRIYQLIKSLDHTYRFSIRNHSSLMMDTVLYCY